MKPTILFLFAMMFALSAHCQKSYWVIESNVKALDQTVVKVYDITNTLIGERQIDRRVTLASKRDKRMLNRMADRMYRERQDVLAERQRRQRPARIAKV